MKIKQLSILFLVFFSRKFSDKDTAIKKHSAKYLLIDENINPENEEFFIDTILKNKNQKTLLDSFISFSFSLIAILSRLLISKL